MTPRQKSTARTLLFSALAGWLGLVAHFVWMANTGPRGDAMFWTMMPPMMTVLYLVEFAAIAVPFYFLTRKFRLKIHPLAAAIAGAAVFALMSPLIWRAATTPEDVADGNWIFFSEAGAIWGAACVLTMSLLLRREPSPTPTSSTP